MERFASLVALLQLFNLFIFRVFSFIKNNNTICLFKISFQNHYAFVAYDFLNYFFVLLDIYNRDTETMVTFRIPSVDDVAYNVLLCMFCHNHKCIDHFPWPLFDLIEPNHRLDRHSLDRLHRNMMNSNFDIHLVWNYLMSTDLKL